MPVRQGRHAAFVWRKLSRLQQWRSGTACKTPRRRWASSSWRCSSPTVSIRTPPFPGGSRSPPRAPSRSAPTLAVASAISLGTYSGGWWIMRTLGRRIIHLDPPRGFASETVAAATLYVMAIGLHAPVSTTHTITSSLMGAGASKRLSAVRWGGRARHRVGLDRHNPDGRTDGCRRVRHRPTVPVLSTSPCCAIASSAGGRCTSNG